MSGERERSPNKDNFLTGSKITMIVLRNFLNYKNVETRSGIMRHYSHCSYLLDIYYHTTYIQLLQGLIFEP